MTTYYSSLPKMAPVALPVTFKETTPTPTPEPSKSHPFRALGRITIATFGLLCYAATGILVAVLIMQLRWHLPHWPDATWPG